MRTMNTEKLLKTIPIIQNQMDVLLDFNVSVVCGAHLLVTFGCICVSVVIVTLTLYQVNANELTNGVINAAFMLLFKDAIRLFAAYNEGIINLLGKTRYCGFWNLTKGRGSKLLKCFGDLSRRRKNFIVLIWKQHKIQLWCSLVNRSAPQ